MPASSVLRDHSVAETPRGNEARTVLRRRIRLRGDAALASRASIPAAALETLILFLAVSWAWN
jgi:hypothetical protein